MNQPARILTVDDEASIRLTLTAMLQRAGYDVASAESGEEAVTLLEQQGFDLMLVDLKMPGMGGMQVVAAARQRQPDLAIIVLTGHGSLDTAVEGLHQGIFDYVLKTTEPAQVIERVKAGLEARRQQLRQKTLLDVVGTAVQELRGPVTTSNEFERVQPFCRAGSDDWRAATGRLAPGCDAGGTNAAIDPDRVSRAAVPS